MTIINQKRMLKLAGLLKEELEEVSGPRIFDNVEDLFADDFTNVDYLYNGKKGHSDTEAEVTEPVYKDEKSKSQERKNMETRYHTLHSDYHGGIGPHDTDELTDQQLAYAIEEYEISLGLR